MAHPNGRVGDADDKGMNGGHGHGADNGEKKSCLQRFSEVVIGGLEGAFGRLGRMIGTYPERFIVGAIILSGLTGIGLLALFTETSPEKLWVPEGSEVLDSKAWIDDNYPSNIVRENIISKAPNVLKAAQIKALMSIYTESFTLASPNGIKLQDVCIKSGSTCIVNSILEVWSNDAAVVNALTDDEVLKNINDTKTSPLTGKPIIYSSFLGDIEYDSTGAISGAAVIKITWLTEGEDSKLDDTEEWEEEFIDMAKKGHSSFTSTYYWAGRSFADESSKAINGDIALLTAGYVIVVVFVFFILGNFNFVEQRAWLTLGGFVCIALSLLISVGLSSAFQQVFGPLQSILPFLILGIGVDDMFVILGAMNNLPPEEQNLEIPELIGKVLAHAGVSITVTSLTDFVAFMIGATTIIPALRSFCIYAAVGIIGLYVLQATMFTACLAIDVRRLRANRDGCLCCIKHGEDYEKNKCSQKQFIPYVFKKGLAPIITKLPVRIIVIIITLALFGVNIWGFISLEQYFNPYWFIPDDSYATEFINVRDKYFPTGDLGHIYCGEVSYYTSQEKFDKMNEYMMESPYIKNGSTDSWFESLTDWLATTSDPAITSMLDPNKYPSSRENFIDLTYQLTTDEAPRMSSNLQFGNSSNLTIKASRFPFDHIYTDDAQTQIDAMDHTYEIVTRAGLTRKECFPYSFSYLTWETNKVIKEELYRNLLLAMICVFVVGIILIANIMTTFIVFIGVIFTLVDVGGTMHFWGLTIDTVTCIILTLSIGLAVDYSAHIGHMFMRVRGNRKDRVKETVREIGPAVFQGGFSTFLAFVLLSDSNSYLFRTFFKVNFLVVLYGLFHGLIFIPVLLSFVGPDPYPNADLEYKNHRKNSMAPRSPGGAENPGFQAPEEDKKGSEMASLSNLPPLKKPQGQSNTDYENMDTSGSSGRASSGDSPPPEYNNQPSNGNPDVTVVRM